MMINLLEIFTSCSRRNSY